MASNALGRPFATDENLIKTAPSEESPKGARAHPLPIPSSKQKTRSTALLTLTFGSFWRRPICLRTFGLLLLRRQHGRLMFLPGAGLLLVSGRR